MKKFISLLLMLSLVFCFAACGGNKTPDENIGNNNVVDNIDDNSDDNIITSNKEIALDDVEKAPVSPEVDFEVYEDAGVITVDSYIGNAEVVVIPETINGKPVTSIGIGAFSNASTVRAVKLADTIENVGDSAFFGNPNLEVLVAGTGLKVIDFCGISKCENLRILKLNDGLERIGIGGIGENPKLKEVYFPSSLTQIGYVPAEDSIIICEAGSYAEEYAKNKGYEYRLK